MQWFEMDTTIHQVSGCLGPFLPMTVSATVQCELHHRTRAVDVRFSCRAVILLAVYSK